MSRVRRFDPVVDEGAAHTHGGTLAISIAQDVDTRAWRVLVSLSPVERIPAGHLVAADLGPADVVDVITALTVAGMQADERNLELAAELAAVEFGVGDGL